MIAMFGLVLKVSAEVIDLEGQTVGKLGGADFKNSYAGNTIINGTVQVGSLAEAVGVYTIGAGAVVTCGDQQYVNGDCTFNIVEGGEYKQTGSYFVYPFRYGQVKLIMNGGKFTSISTASALSRGGMVNFGYVWNNKSSSKGKDVSAVVVMTNRSELCISSGNLQLGSVKSNNESGTPVKTSKTDLFVTNSIIKCEKGQIVLACGLNKWLSDWDNSYVRAVFGPNSEITAGQIFVNGQYPQSSVVFDGATIHWTGNNVSFIGHTTAVGDVYTIDSHGLTVDIPEGKSLTCDSNASSLKGEGGITKIGEGSITWNKVSSNGSQGMTFTGPMVVSNGMWTSTLGYASKAFRADGGTLVLSGSLSAENVVLAATKGGNLKLEGAAVADKSPDLELAGGGRTDYFTRDGTVGAYTLDSLTLRPNAVLDIDGNAEAIDAITATVLNIEATSDKPATINIDFSEMPNTGRTFNLFAVDDIAKLNVQPKLGNLVVPHSVSIKDGVVVLTITADDFVWNGTKQNWNDEGAWTKGAEGVKWTDGNNAVFSIPNSTAILDASASVAELHFSANAVISAKEVEESPSLLTASNIIVDEGVTGSISAELAQDIEKTGSGTLELSRSREGKTTRVLEGTIKFTDSVNVGDLVLGTDVNKLVALDYSGNKLTGKINSFMNVGTAVGGNVTLKNGIYEYTEVFRVWNGSLTINSDADVAIDTSANRWVCVGGNNSASEAATDVDALLVVDGGEITNDTGYHLGIGDFGTYPSKAKMVVKNGGSYVGKSNIYVAQGMTGTLIVDGEGSSVTASTLYFNGEARDAENEHGYVSVTNGGLIAVNSITRSNGLGNGYFNFDGGILKARTSGTLIAESDKLFVNVNIEGGTIDNNGYDITIAEDLRGEGEIAITGSGVTTLSGTIDVGTFKQKAGTTIALNSLNADTAPVKAKSFMFEQGAILALPSQLAKGRYKLFELTQGELDANAVAGVLVSNDSVPCTLVVEGNAIYAVVEHEYISVKNKVTASQDVGEDTWLFNEGGLDIARLTFADNAKLTFDPIKTPVYVYGTTDDTGLIVGANAKIALTPNYATMTCGRITLLTFKTEYAKNLPENLNDLFDASSIAPGVEWNITTEDVPDDDPYRKNLILTVGDYANAPEIRILPIGDSITQGVTKDSQGDYPQYRTAIAARLAASGYKPKMVGIWKYAKKNAANVLMPEDWVWHCGISGDGIKTSSNTASSQRGGVRDNLHLYLDVAGNVDVITLLIGTNDIGAGGESAEDTYAAWKALVQEMSAQRPNAKIIGATLLDRDGEGTANHGKVVAFNALLKADYEVNNLPANFVLIDLYEAVPLAVEGNFFSDKLHLNWKGCSATAEAFATSIMGALPLSGENAFGGTQDDTVTDEAQVALGADVLVPETYRGGMERAFVIDAETPTNVFTKASPYTSVGASVSLTRKVKRAGYYMELVRAGTNRRRFVWVDFDAEGKTLDDIDFPWSGENMQFIAENMHVYSNDSSIRNVSPDIVGVKGIIEGTYHNYTAPDALEGAPKDIFGSSDTYGWNDTMGSGNAGYGCFQAHRIFSREEGDAHWNDAQVLFAWNRWGSSTATDEIGIGDYACHANGVGNTMDYTWTSEKGTDGLPDTVTASAYQVRRLEIWASFEEETRPGVWTGAAGNNSLLDKNNWTGNTLPGTEDTVFIGASNDIELVCDGQFSVKAIEISGDGKLEISGSGSIAVASSIIRMGASRPVVNVPVEFKTAEGGDAAIDVTGEVDFQGGVTGTVPENHTTFYGNYTLTGTSWTLSSPITLAANATVTATAMEMHPNGKLLNAETGSKLKIKQITFDKNIRGNIFGVYNGELDVGTFYSYYPNGTITFNSGFAGLFRFGHFHGYTAGKTSDINFSPASSATIVAGGTGIESQTGWFKLGSLVIRSSGDWTIKLTKNNYTYSSVSQSVEINSGSFDIDTSDYGDSSAAGHTVTVVNKETKYAESANYLLKGAGAMSAFGIGTMQFQSSANFTGGFTASNGVTVAVNKNAYPGKGNVTIKDTATLKLAQSSSGTVPVAGTLTMEGGSRLLIPALACDVVPLSAAAVVFNSISDDKKVALEIQNATEIGEGIYPILSSASEISESALNAFAQEQELEGCALRLSSDRRMIMLVCGSVNYWVGDVSTDLTDASNWLNGVPGEGESATIACGAETTLTIPEGKIFSPSSIVFSGGAPVTIEGPGIISGIVAVTNSSPVSHTINAPVHFAGNIAVAQNARGYATRNESHITFAGGAYAAEGCSIAPWRDGYSYAVFGRYVLANTEESPYAITEYKVSSTDDIRFYVAPGSALEVPYAGAFTELDLAEGGVVTNRVVSMPEGQRLSHKNYGEYVIADEFTVSGSNKKDGYAGYNAGTGAANVFKIEKATCNKTDGYTFYFAEANGASHGTYYFGEGGINFGSGKGYFGIGKNADGDAQMIRPWYSDFIIGTGAGNTDGFDMWMFRSITFNTDDENGVGRKITLNARPRFNNTPSFTVAGSGTVLVNSVASNNAQPPVTVTDTATLAFKPGASLTTDNITVNSGATLAVAGSGTFALGGGLTLADGACLGFNYSTRNAPVLDLADKNVTLGDNKNIVVKITSENGKRPLAGEKVLTSGRKFAGVTVTLAPGAPNWVKGIAVVDGEIVLDVKPMGTRIIVR